MGLKFKRFNASGLEFNRNYYSRSWGSWELDNHGATNGPGSAGRYNIWNNCATVAKGGSGGLGGSGAVMQEE